MKDKIEIALRVSWWALLALALGACIFIRIRLLPFPLERDEGEYAYGGQLILQGIVPYKLAYSMKLPGTAAAYAIIMSILGQTVTAIHLGLLLVNLATSALLFLLGWRLTNSKVAGIATAASYAIMSLSPSMLGFSAHATHLLMLPVVAAVLLMLRGLRRQSLLDLALSGLLFGIALIMKQPAGVFVLSGVAWVSYSCWRSKCSWSQFARSTLIFAGAALLPLVLTFLIVWQSGVFDKFRFWTVSYAREYATLSSPSDAAAYLRASSPDIVGGRWILCTIAGLGLITGFVRHETRPSAVYLLTFAFFSTAALSVGFYFRPHYFFLVMPAIALLVGLAIANVPLLFNKVRLAVEIVTLVVLATGLVLPLIQDRDFLFALNATEASRFTYGECPFPESERIGQYIREHSEAGDEVAVLGSEPQIYFYARRHSATGYLYTYGLMESQRYAHQMQLEMIREIEAARPKYFVSIVINDSWWPRPTSERLIFNWADQYLSANYSAVGLVNIVDNGRTDYYLDHVPESLPSLRNYVLIYQRR